MYASIGNALKEQNLVQDAIASYRSAIKLRPDFAIAHGNLGSCYYDIGDHAAAIKSFNYAIQLEPNYPDAYNNLGMMGLRIIMFDDDDDNHVLMIIMIMLMMMMMMSRVDHSSWF
jgi:tetratricopeptide (TPR) repeat protein